MTKPNRKAQLYDAFLKAIRSVGVRNLRRTSVFVRSVEEKPNDNCKSPQEFSRIMWQRIEPYGWDWGKDVRPWLRDAFMGKEFGDESFQWSPRDARMLADEFLAEASTW